MSSIHAFIVKVGPKNQQQNHSDYSTESGLDCVYQGNYRERESSRSAK